MTSFGKLNDFHNTESQISALVDDSISQNYPTFYQQMSQTNITHRPFTFGPAVDTQPAIIAQPAVAQPAIPKFGCQGITMNPSDLTFRKAMEDLQKTRQEKLKQDEKAQLIDTLYDELTLIRSQIDKLTKSTDMIYEILRKL